MKEQATPQDEPFSYKDVSLKTPSPKNTSQKSWKPQPVEWKDVPRRQKWFICVFFSLAALSIFLLFLDKNDTGGDASTNVAHTAPVQQPQETHPVVAEKPVVDISVVDLASEYDANEVATDEKYKDVTLRISGKVLGIEKGFDNDMFLKLKTGDELSNSQMFMDDDQKDALIQMKKGVQVRVICDRVARVMDSPTGYGCKLVS